MRNKKIRILYGVSGEGFGHSSRAKEIISYLEKQGHIVKILTYGQAYKILKKEFDITKIKGMHLFFKKNKIDTIETFKYNFKNFPKNFTNIKKFHKIIQDFKPDLCITDMEPFTAILSFWYKLPLISIDNQHRLTHTKIKIPLKYKKDFLIAKEVTRNFVRKANAFIILSFIKSKPKKENAFVVPPVLRKEVTKLKPKKGKHILVYLTKKDKRLLNILKTFNEKFIVYGFNKNSSSGNLKFKKAGPHFIKDLAKAKAVIATAGFTLMSEALFLKKPYFAIPLQGQFEQTLNALILKESKLGEYSEIPKKEELNNFLENLNKYEKNLKKYKSNHSEIFKVLDKTLKNTINFK